MPSESATAPRPRVECSLNLVTEICERIAEGGHLKAICREDGKPHYTTFFRWLQAHPEAQELYRAARQMGGHWHADRIIEMCDEQPERVKDEKGAARIDSGWVQLQRVRIDALKWVASKWFPKEYGDRVAAEITGKDGGPITHRDDTPGLGGVKAALAGMLARASAAAAAAVDESRDE